MPYSLQVGSIQCHIISDGVQASDGGGFFGLVPRMLWEKVIKPNERNEVPSALRVLLIESDQGPILVDTGIGDKHSEKVRSFLGIGDRRGRLLSDLQKIGYKPEDIAIVILTHLHNDHAGGATRWNTPDFSPGEVVPTFPNARYIVQRLDLAEASFPNERTRGTYFSHNWQPLIDRAQLDVVDGDFEVATGVYTEVAPGHTEGIQTVWIEDGDHSLLFLGDACSWAIHMDRLAWVPSFDILPMMSIESKRRLKHKALMKNTTLLFQHDGQIVTGRLKSSEKGPRVQPETTEDPWYDASAQ